MSMPFSLTAGQRERLGDVAALYQLPAISGPKQPGTLRFGLMTDPQYADIETDLANDLYYRHALHKLPQAIAALNQHPLDFVVTLGDLVDRHWQSYATLLPLYAGLQHPHVVVLGNHDAQTIAEHLNGRLPLPKSYYSFRLAGWRFVVYDGNDLSLYCNHHNGHDRQQAIDLLADLQARGQPQAQPWNGAVGAQQWQWLVQQLQEAQRVGDQVIVFGHYPLAPHNAHCLLNGPALAALFSRYGVRACFAGHDHRGCYGREGETSFFTLKGMLNGAEAVPFAVVELDAAGLRVQGYGGENSYAC